MIYQRILEQCLTNAPQLRKIKLSNVNLNDAVIVEKLCQIIEQKDLVSTIDLSWAGLSSQHLLKISKSLNSFPNNILNLNLSYNSLNFKENPMESFFNSEDFLEQFCAYLSATSTLKHLDISGLNFGKHQLAELCPIIAAVDNL